MEISEFASKLFACRDILHLYHLQTRSYAAHKALGGLYDYMVDWTDSFLETYKGFAGDFTVDTIHVESPNGNPADYVEQFVKQVLMVAKAEMSDDMPLYGFLVNKIEENIAECYHTIYKLRFLS